MTKNLYSNLGVEPSADTTTIKKAYRRKVKKSHPDVGGDPSDFREIQLAYDILSDERKRQRYDETGDTGERRDSLAERVILMVIDVVSKHDPIRTNYIQVIKNDLGRIKDSLVSEQGSTKGRANKFREAAKRFKTKKSSNILSSALNDRAAQEDAKLSRLKTEIEMVTQTEKFFDGYEYEFEQVQVSKISVGPPSFNDDLAATLVHIFGQPPKW